MRSFFKSTKHRMKAFASATRCLELSPSSDDIFLFASRRGGSTWLMETICSDSSIHWIDQPFSFFSSHPSISKHLPEKPFSEYIELSSPTEISQVSAYTEDLLTGRLRLNSDWRLYERRFWSKKSRTLLKILQAKSIAEQLCKLFPATPLFLFRHPLPQAISVQKAGWTNHCPAFLRNEWFRESVLREDRANECEKIFEQSDELTKFVMNWSFENYLPLKYVATHHDWVRLSYEDCVLTPDKVVSFLQERLKLSNQQDLLNQMRRPSRTTKITQTNGQPSSSKLRIDSWFENCTSIQLAECQRILDILDIDVYEATCPTPNSNLLCFETKGS